MISNTPIKAVSGKTTKSKMVLLVTKVNGFPQLIFVTKCSNIDFALVLDTLLLFFITHYKLTKCDKRTSPFSKIQ